MARSGRPADRYASRRRPGQGAPAWLAVAGILLLVAVVGAAGWFAFRQVKADEIDEATLCPLTGATGSLAVLLDMTDPVSGTQALALHAALDKAVLGSPRGTLVAIGRVSDQPDRMGAAFALCRPMTGAEGGDLIRNSSQVDARFQEGFVKPYRAEIDAMLDAGKAKQSPIMEGLQALLAGVAGLPVAAGATRRVVIVSDLLQNSDAMSFYRRQDWQSFRDSPAYGRLARNLDGVDVTILRVPRTDGKVDPAAVDDFWVRYLETQGAASVEPRTIGDL